MKEHPKTSVIVAVKTPGHKLVIVPVVAEDDHKKVYAPAFPPIGFSAIEPLQFPAQFALTITSLSSITCGSVIISG